MLRDPSGMSWLSDRLGIDVDLNKGVKQSVEQVITGAHDFVQAVGATIDSIVKNKTAQVILVVIAVVLVASWAGHEAYLATESYFASTVAAGVAGGLVGGVGTSSLGLGSFEKGFKVGFVMGAIWWDSLTVVEFLQDYKIPLAAADLYTYQKDWSDGHQSKETGILLFKAIATLLGLGG